MTTFIEGIQETQDRVPTTPRSSPRNAFMDETTETKNRSCYAHAVTHRRELGAVSVGAHAPHARICGRRSTTIPTPTRSRGRCDSHSTVSPAHAATTYSQTLEARGRCSKIDTALISSASDEPGSPMCSRKTWSYFLDMTLIKR